MHRSARPSSSVDQRGLMPVRADVPSSEGFHDGLGHSRRRRPTLSLVTARKLPCLDRRASLELQAWYAIRANDEAVEASAKQGLGARAGYGIEAANAVGPAPRGGALPVQSLPPLVVEKTTAPRPKGASVFAAAEQWALVAEDRPDTPEPNTSFGPPAFDQDRPPSVETRTAVGIAWPIPPGEVAANRR
jgi:hypothetical protein